MRTVASFFLTVPLPACDQYSAKRLVAGYTPGFPPVARGYIVAGLGSRIHPASAGHHMVCRELPFGGLHNRAPASKWHNPKRETP